VKAPTRYVLKLFVAGASDRSRQAVLQVRQLCESRLAGRHVLEVIDVHQHPELAEASRVPATPALVRESPRPARRFFGNLGDAEAVCEGLGLSSSEEPPREAPEEPGTQPDPRHIGGSAEP
jgi:circadian clock protein KaiB